MCENDACDISTCTQRHHRQSKYYIEFNRYKYSEWCSYAHFSKTTEVVNLKVETSKILDKIKDIEKALTEKTDNSNRDIEKLLEVLEKNFEKKMVTKDN